VASDLESIKGRSQARNQRGKIEYGRLYQQCAVVSVGFIVHVKHMYQHAGYSEVVPITICKAYCEAEIRCFCSTSTCANCSHE
jgi:hypothetical protein